MIRIHTVPFVVKLVLLKWSKNKRKSLHGFVYIYFSSFTASCQAPFPPVHCADESLSSIKPYFTRMRISFSVIGFAINNRKMTVEAA